MLPFLAVIIYAWGAVAGLALNTTNTDDKITTSPAYSVFLSSEQLNSALAHDILCSYSVIFSGASRIADSHVHMSREHVIQTLQRHKHQHPLNTSEIRTIQGNTSIGRYHSVIATDRYWLDSLAAYASDARFNCTVYFFPLRTPQSLLCLEVMAASGRFTHIVPNRVETTLAFTARYSIDTLEAHFRLPVVSPSSEIAAVFTDKNHFAQWIQDNRFGAFVPKTFSTPAEASFPCMVSV